MFPHWNTSWRSSNAPEMYIFVFVSVSPPQAHVIGTESVVNLDWWKKPRIKSRHSDVGQPMAWQKLDKIPPSYKCSAKALIPMKTVWCRKALVSYLLLAFPAAFGLFNAICTADTFGEGSGVKDDNAHPHPLSRHEYAASFCMCLVYFFQRCYIDCI